MEGNYLKALGVIKDTFWRRVKTWKKGMPPESLSYFCNFFAWGLQGWWLHRVATMLGEKKICLLGMSEFGAIPWWLQSEGTISGKSKLEKANPKKEAANIVYKHCTNLFQWRNLQAWDRSPTKLTWSDIWAASENR